MENMLNTCPNCHKKASFTPEQMPCDGSLVLWCNVCGEYVSQTLTIKTFINWWDKYEKREIEDIPPVSKKTIAKIAQIQEDIKAEIGQIVENVELHIKDFNHYKMDKGVMSND